MSSPKNSRRSLQRLGLVGIGSAVLLVGIAPAAGAAEDVVISLEPTEVALLNYPIENHSWAPPAEFDPSADVDDAVVVEYGQTLTVDLAAELDPTDAVVEIVFDEDADGNDAPDFAYSSAATPDTSMADTVEPLVVAQDGNDLVITLPADNGATVTLATLSIAPLETGLGPAFTPDPLLEYELDFSATTVDGTTLGADATLFPELIALAQVPCALSSATPCPVAVTAGTTLTLDLPADSVLRELGLADLTGLEVALQSIDDPTADPVVLDVEVSDSTATVALPAELTAGSYALVLGQPITSGLSIVVGELAVSAPAVVAPPAAAPTTSAAPAVVNAGLKSNTGVEAVETGSTGTVAVAAGAGMLLLAGAGGVAVARTRRRPAAEGGTCA